MASVSEDRIRAVVTDCLSKFDSLKEIDLKGVRSAVSEQLDIPLEIVKNQYKDDIKKIIAEYRKRQRVISKDDKVHGRFSKKDSEVVLQTIEEYAAKQGIDTTEVCAFFREKKKDHSHSALWDSLEELLPHRSRKVCQ